MLTPIRAERAKWEAKIPEVYDILLKGTEKSREKTNQTLEEVREAMRINYFKDDSIISDWEKWITK